MIRSGFYSGRAKWGEGGGCNPGESCKVQGDMLRVTASGLSLTATNGREVPSSVGEIFGFNG